MDLVAIVIMIIVSRVLSTSHKRYFLQFMINPLFYVYTHCCIEYT